MVSLPALSPGPAQEQLDKLDKVFGAGYFEHGRLVITVARDITGMMKIAHKLQAKVNEAYGSMVEVIMEHVKYEWWAKLHETTNTLGLHKGQEVPDCQVTDIPEGIRQHPYKRDHLPTLEVLLLWEDSAGLTKGHCLYSRSHPSVPCVEQVDEIFSELGPYFAKRWILVELSMGSPIRGDLEELELDLEQDQAQAQAQAAEDGPGPEADRVGAGVEVTILACHAFGFARDGRDGAAPHVRQCQPISMHTVTDDAGRARICFLPADVNRVQVPETSRFHGTDVSLPRSEMRSLSEGHTVVKITLTPKALASLNVHIFALPSQLPVAADTDGIIDWANEEREALPGATVEVKPLKDTATEYLLHTGNGCFVPELGGLPEGCVSLVASCTGFDSEEKTIMLLVGANDVYVPLQRTK